MMNIQETLQKIARGTAEIIDMKLLEEKLVSSQKRKKPLCIKAGFDPTAPDIHLGHYVLLKKLRQFQDFGHQVNFLIGDFTAQIGDPSGRDQTRKKMDPKQIAQNAKTYKAQVFKILDPKKTKVVFNSRWLKKLTAQDIMELSARCTVAQMLARADFKKRFEEKREISLLEFIYPLLQGYDSVHLNADVELGGTDQKFNLLMGRQLQESYNLSPQVVMMTPLLEGTDGVQKMSKSLGNYIGINEPPNEIFGKVMSISDELMYRYYELLTDEDMPRVKQVHPKEAKLQLAQKLVEQFYGHAAAQSARKAFEQTFSQRQAPEDVTEYVIRTDGTSTIVDVLIESKLVASRNEARRLLQQGGISFQDTKVTVENWPLQEGVLKVGKRRFLRLVKKSS